MDRNHLEEEAEEDNHIAVVEVVVVVDVVAEAVLKEGNNSNLDSSDGNFDHTVVAAAAVGVEEGSDFGVVEGMTVEGMAYTRPFLPFISLIKSNYQKQRSINNNSKQKRTLEQRS